MGKLFRNGIAIMKGCILKLFHPNNIGVKLRCFKGAEIRIYKGSSAHIGMGLKVDTNALISVLSDGDLVIGNNVGVGSHNMIICHNHIEIGDGTIMGPGVCIYDHDHTFSAEKGVDRTQYSFGEVFIGKNCWIGANTIILKGTIIGDNCVIGAGCVIKGNYPSGSLIIQKRETTVEKIKG
ncbi:acyltransferase [Streptococcus porci]|uniref:acyltransferase n=1 Tax=Streptococcus porci TaxID=502567 RepID=UPI00055E5186|nr:acyltransferase [Streptococcus porci]